jgi:hypothetical protein
VNALVAERYIRIESGFLRYMRNGKYVGLSTLSRRRMLARGKDQLHPRVTRPGFERPGMIGCFPRCCRNWTIR